MGEPFEVRRLDGAEVTLGVDVEPGRLGDLGAEVLRQPGASGPLVPGVDAAIGRIVAEVVEQVADVMQQGRHDQGVGRPVEHGEVRGLERVLGLRDRLAEVGVMAPGLEQPEDLFHSMHRTPRSALEEGSRVAPRDVVLCPVGPPSDQRPLGSNLPGRIAAMPLDFLVVFGSVRRDRRGIGLARFLVGAIQARGHSATLVDPMETPLPLLDRMYKEYPKDQAPRGPRTPGRPDPRRRRDRGRLGRIQPQHPAGALEPPRPLP